MIRTAVVIEDRSGQDTVGLYDRVTVYLEEDDEETTFQIVTTMRQDAERMGELAAEELARAVEEGRSYIPGRHVVGGTLLPGETVKKLTP